MKQWSLKQVLLLSLSACWVWFGWNFIHYSVKSILSSITELDQIQKKQCEFGSLSGSIYLSLLAEAKRNNPKFKFTPLAITPYRDSLPKAGSTTTSALLLLQSNSSAELRGAVTHADMQSLGALVSLIKIGENVNFEYGAVKTEYFNLNNNINNFSYTLNKDTFYYAIYPSNLFSRIINRYNILYDSLKLISDKYYLSDIFITTKYNFLDSRNRVSLFNKSVNYGNVGSYNILYYNNIHFASSDIVGGVIGLREYSDGSCPFNYNVIKYKQKLDKYTAFSSVNPLIQ